MSFNANANHFEIPEYVYKWSNRNKSERSVGKTVECHFLLSIRVGLFIKIVSRRFNIHPSVTES